jgi:hypothetical protein
MVRRLELGTSFGIYIYDLNFFLLFSVLGFPFILGMEFRAA